MSDTLSKSKSVACLVANPFTNDSRVLKTSRSLREAGYDVTVFALHDADLPLEDVVDGVPVRRIHLRSRGISKWRPIQLFVYIEFVLRIVRAIRDFDYYHCNDLNTLPVGVFAKLLRRPVKVVYDCHEYESNHWPGQKAYSIKLLETLERICIPAADKVITVSDSIAGAYTQLYGVPKPALVLNCPHRLETAQSTKLRDALGIPNNRVIYLYQGAMTKGRGLQPLLDFFRDNPSDTRALVMMGYGPYEKAARELAEKSDGVYFMPAVPPDEILDYTSSADVGLCLIEGLCKSYEFCLPNKLFEYVMAGLPVLVSPLTELTRFVEETKTGLTANVYDAAQMLDAMDTIESTLVGKTANSEAFETARDKFCWERQQDALWSVYAELES